MRKRNRSSAPSFPHQAQARSRGVFAPVLGVLAVSALLASAAGAGVAYVASLVAAPAGLAARGTERAPDLLRPPVAASIAATAPTPIASGGHATVATAMQQDPASLEVPLPSAFAATLAEQRAEIDRLQAQLSALVAKTERSVPPAPAVGPPPLLAIEVRQRPEPKRPRESLFGPPNSSPPPAPELQRRPPVLAAQRGQTEIGRTQAAPNQIARQEPSKRLAPKTELRPDEARRAASAVDGAPRSYRFDELAQIKVGDRIPDWGLVSAVSRDASGGISIRTESGLIRKDAP